MLQALETVGCDYPVELVHGCAHAFLASICRFWARSWSTAIAPILHATRTLGIGTER